MGGRKKPRAPLCAQEVVERKILRIQYRLRGGAPGSGQAECYSFLEGRCEYGSRCQFYHEQRGSSCTICGSDDHSWEQCIRYGGGQYDPNKDPRVLAAAEKEAARAEWLKQPQRPPSKRPQPVEASHAPPRSTRGKNHNGPRITWRANNVWYPDDTVWLDRPEQEEDVLSILPRLQGATVPGRAAAVAQRILLQLLRLQKASVLPRVAAVMMQIQLQR